MKNANCKPEEDSQPKENVELGEEPQGKESRVEEELKAEVEPAICTGANTIDDTDNELINGNHQNIAIDREEAVNDAHGMPVTGNYDEVLDKSLCGGHKAPFDATREETATSLHEEPLPVNDTHGMPVTGNYDELLVRSLDGAYEAHPDGTHEETATSSHGEHVPSTCGEPVHGSLDETANNYNEELVTEPLEDSGNQKEAESTNAQRPNPTRHRGKPKFKRLVEFDSLRYSL